MKYTVIIVENETNNEVFRQATDCIIGSVHTGESNCTRDLSVLTGSGEMAMAVINDAVNAAVQTSQAVCGDDRMFMIAVLRRFGHLLPSNIEQEDSDES